MPFAEIDNEIISVLKVKPMSVYEISYRTRRAWRTVRDHLIRLRELGKVECHCYERSKLWCLKQGNLVSVEEPQIVNLDVMKIIWDRVEAKELMYYEKSQSKFRMPLIEEGGILVPLNLFEAIRTVLARNFGHHRAESILFEIGREHALYAIKKFSNLLRGGHKSLAEKLFDCGINLELGKKIFKSIYESQGWFKVIDFTWGKNNVFKFKYTFESFAYSRVYPCKFIEGYLVGFIQVLFNENVVGHKEVKCVSQGNDYCEFHVEVENDIQEKFGSLSPITIKVRN